MIGSTTTRISYSSDHSSDDSANHNQESNKSVLFVGNLSYFCTEKDLRELFQQYAPVVHARVMYNEHNTRSLMYGFVTLASPQAARDVERILDDCMFLGRNIKIGNAQRKSNMSMNGTSYNTSSSMGKGCQVHVSFCSFFPEHEITQKPTEVFLRNVFSGYGTILDVSVKDYQVYQGKNMQEGYGFVTFASYESAMRVCQEAQNLTIHFISMTCTLTHQHNPASKKHQQQSKGNNINQSVIVSDAKFSPPMSSRDLLPVVASSPTTVSGVFSPMPAPYPQSMLAAKTQYPSMSQYVAHTQVVPPPANWVSPAAHHHYPMPPPVHNSRMYAPSATLVNPQPMTPVAPILQVPTTAPPMHDNNLYLPHTSSSMTYYPHHGPQDQRPTTYVRSY